MLLLSTAFTDVRLLWPVTACLLTEQPWRLLLLYAQDVYKMKNIDVDAGWPRVL